MKGSNESKDTTLLIPAQNDIVAVKCQGEDYKIGVIIAINLHRRVKVRLLYYGHCDE